MNTSKAALEKGLVIDFDAITKAHERAVREAVLDHARSGFSIAVSRDGQIVHLSPEQIIAEYEAADAAEKSLKNGAH